MKTAVFSIHEFEKPYLLKAAIGSHELVFISKPLNVQTAILAEGCQAACLFVTDCADASILQKLKAINIRYITLRSAGYNNVDIEEAKRLGIRVARVADYSPSAIAEHAVALMLALNRRLIVAYAQAYQFNFCLDGLVGFDMKGKTVGIIGTGKIGSQVARILQGFGCRLLAYDVIENNNLIQENKVEYVTLENLLAQSDIITLHTPLTPQTKHLIRRATIAQMKRGVMLINTGRGALIDTADVIAAVESATIGYLGMDVYEYEEGLFFENHSQDLMHDKTLAKLMDLPNVIITGHQAFLTADALTNIAVSTMHNLECFASCVTSDNMLV